MVEFELDGSIKVPNATFTTASLPPIRVFNRDFIAASIRASGSRVDPIYYLGRDSVEKQQQVEIRKVDLDSARNEVTAARSGKEAAERRLDDFCISKAKHIKDLLLGSKHHANYNKNQFAAAAKALTTLSASLKTKMPDDEKERLRKQKDAKPKDFVSPLNLSVPDFGALLAETKGLMKRSVVSQTLDELEKDKEIGSWVQQGLKLHSGRRKTDLCGFCGQLLTASRRESLEAHFNDAFAAFQTEIAHAARRIEEHRSRLDSTTLPESSRFYDHMTSEAMLATDTTEHFVRVGLDTLDRLLSALRKKKDEPFKPSSLDGGVGEFDPQTGEKLLAAVASINVVVEKHNEMTENFQSQVEDACKELEELHVAEAFADYDKLRTDVTDAERALQAVFDKPSQIEKQIAQIEREISEHLTPADELNGELRSYLGRDELQFQVRGSGYALTRSSEPVSHLSEGETTAIAFLYFLKSLKDKSFDLSKGVVVIDDPISSLDANSLFSAFGYMRERTKACGQLFVLTHNFGFFRQVRNWFLRLPKSLGPKAERPFGRFFYMRAGVDVGGQRTATLGPLAKLLQDHESEYHFLFKCVHSEAERDNAVDLEQYYNMPNIARRLLEAFLAFKYPHPKEGLTRRIERVDFDPGRKIRILRLLHTYSHSDHVGEPEHDPTVLSETRQILRDVLEMIEAVDPSHYAGMHQAVCAE